MSYVRASKGKSLALEGFSFSETCGEDMNNNNSKTKQNENKPKAVFFQGKTHLLLLIFMAFFLFAKRIHWIISQLRKTALSSILTHKGYVSITKNTKLFSL